MVIFVARQWHQVMHQETYLAGGPEELVMGEEGEESKPVKRTGGKWEDDSSDGRTMPVRERGRLLQLRQEEGRKGLSQGRGSSEGGQPRVGGAVGRTGQRLLTIRLKRITVCSWWRS